MKNECPRKGQGLRKCYECQRFTPHKAYECPQRMSKQGNSSKRGGYKGKRNVNNNQNNKFDSRLHARNKRLFKTKGNRYNRNSQSFKQARDDGKRQSNKENDSNASKQFKNKKDNTNNQQNQSRTGISETPTIHFAYHQQNNPGMCKSNNVASVYCFECQSENRVKTATPTRTHNAKDIKSSLKDDGNQKDSYVSFIVDFGATEHLTNSREIFSSFKNIGTGVIKCANKDSRFNC